MTISALEALTMTSQERIAELTELLNRLSDKSIAVVKTLVDDLLAAETPTAAWKSSSGN